MKSKRRGALLGMVVVVVVVGAMLAPATSQAQTSVRGINNKVIKVGALGTVASLGPADIGAKARFERANKTNELKGYKFAYVGMADDKADPATALSEARRLVTQEQIFALINMSGITPYDYLASQKVLMFGGGFDTTACSSGKPVWNIGNTGCNPASNPASKQVWGKTAQQVMLEMTKLGITKPTAAVMGADVENSKNSTAAFASAFQGAGFDVVYAKAPIPAPPAVVSDFSPYVQQILTSNNGKQPDVFLSFAPSAAQSLGLFTLLLRSGFTGKIVSPFYANALLPLLKGQYVFGQGAPFESTAPGMVQLKADVAAVAPDAPLTSVLPYGYYAADFLIQALKKTGTKNLTADKVHQVASNMTFEIKDVIGPIKYPESFKIGTPNCNFLLSDPNGTAFEIAQPYSCTTKPYPKLPKFGAL